MSNSNKLFLGIIAVLLLILWFKSCDSEEVPQNVTIKVPEVSNSLPKQKPIYVVRTDTVYVTKWKTKTDYVEIETQNPVNDSLALAYQRAQDTIQRYRLFLEAIQIKQFTSEFSDEYIDLVISGEVQGDIRSIKPKYTIKERTIETQVPIKTTALRVLGGASVQTSTDLNTFTYTANLGLQNAKGNIIRAGYSKINGQDYIMAGYDFSIFNIKKKQRKQ